MNSLAARVFAFLVCLSLSWIHLTAQGTRGTLTGTVHDQSGALVVGAEVKATNLESAVTQAATTTEAGAYTIPYVVPGSYRLAASSHGFRTALADNVEVHIAGTVRVDFTLLVGPTTEAIEVSATTPLIETGSSQIGTVTTDTEFHTWPLVIGDRAHRDLQTFIFKSLPGTQGNTQYGSINGDQADGHPVLIEGLPSTTTFNTGDDTYETGPSVDAVAEFKLQTGTLSAQYGGTQTAVANFAMKSGTNRYHGGALWSHKDEVLNANPWNSNALGRPRSPFTENDVSAVFGGPIVKNRTYFFGSWELDRRSDFTVTGTTTLPYQAFKNGDFSRLFDPKFTGDSKSGTVLGQDALGRSIVFGQIYDPLSTRQLPDGTWIRDPFVGNVIPKNRFSSVSGKILASKSWVDPQLDLFRNNNPQMNNTPNQSYDIGGIKVDQVLGDAHRLSLFFNYSNLIQTRGQSVNYLPYPGGAEAGWGTRWVWTDLVRLSEDWVISPTLLNHFILGANIQNTGQHSDYLNADYPAQIGLTGVPQATEPRLNFQGSNTTLNPYPQFGNALNEKKQSNVYMLGDDLTWVHGKHDFRFGFQISRFQQNELPSAAFQFIFNNQATSQPSSVQNTGFSFASFLLGAVQSTNRDIVESVDARRYWYDAFYVQDTWKLTPTFTLNCGLRWEISGRWTEAHNRMSALDPAKPNPGADGFRGAVAFAGNCPTCTGEDSFENTYYKDLGPRLGFAWSPNERFVVRGGYGMNYQQPVTGFMPRSWFGFNGSMAIQYGTGQFGRFAQDPVLNWDNGYPPYATPLPNRDPAVQNGLAVTYFPPDANRQSNVQTWNVGLQFRLPWETVLQTDYIGNKGTHLSSITSAVGMNQAAPKYLALGNVLLADISTHPEIAKPYSSFKGTVGQALRPYPQYLGVSAAVLPVGNSTYHALQVSATKRMSGGLSFLAGYTFSKNLSDTPSSRATWDWGATFCQDYYNRSACKAPTLYHRPQVLRISWIYDLPWGPKRRWLTNGLLADILGGWTISALQSYQSGDPLSLYASGPQSGIFTSGIRANVLLPGDQQVIYNGATPNSVTGTPYLNPAAFAAPPTTSQGVIVGLGNAPTVLPNVRGPALYSEDLSLMKRTGIRWGESTSVEIRADCSNVLNRAGLGNPITNVNSSQFGRILNVSHTPRIIQLGLRLSF